MSGNPVRECSTQVLFNFKVALFFFFEVVACIFVVICLLNVSFVQAMEMLTI